MLTHVFLRKLLPLKLDKSAIEFVHNLRGADPLRVDDWLFDDVSARIRIAVSTSLLTLTSSVLLFLHVSCLPPPDPLCLPLSARDVDSTCAQSNSQYTHAV